MRKVLSIIAAGLAALTVFSCAKEEDKIIFDPSDVVAPVVNDYEITDNALAVHYTAAQFAEGIQKAVHGIVLTNVDGKAVETELAASEKEEGILSVSKSALNKALAAEGMEEGAVCSFSFIVRATLAVANFVIDSKNTGDVSGYELPATPSNPWIDFKDVSAWGVTGSIASAGLNWDKDIVMYTDGGRHVARNVKLTPSDQFKFRKDHAWGENFGGEGDVEPFVCELGTEYVAVAGGKNLGVAAEGVYDLLLDTDAGTFTVLEAFVTYPGFDEDSPWSVIGAIESFEMNWDKDIAMTTNGEWHVAEGVELKATDQFKFRKDQAWGENFGAEGDVEPFICELDTEYPASAGGKNLAVAVDGAYDLLVNPEAKLFKVVETLGGKSGLIGGSDDPGPEPPAVTGWNIIGLNGDWENDILATEDNGVWTAYITAEGDTEFKWRKDGAWDEDYGGVFAALDEPFAAVAGGANIKIGAGFWKVVLNTNDLTITISNGQVWSLIGVNGNWETDIDMALTNGKWVSPVTKITGEFKIRENHAWNNDRGGTFTAVGEPFEAVAGGGNISVPEGNYVVTYDPTAETIVIDETGWGLVGTITSWGESPDIILKEDGLFLVARNIALTENDEIKLRYKSDWGVNRGGRTAVGHAVKAVQGGDNIKPGVAGNYDIWYRPDSDVLFVMTAGSELSYWGVVGTINGWGAPDKIMYEDESGKLVSDEIEVTSEDAIKIRMNETWSVDRGGNFNELGEPFAVTQGGANIVVGRDAKISVSYDPENEMITLFGEYTGDAPDELWSLIGVNGDWEADIDMTLTDGKWVSPAVKMSGSFKLRMNHAWGVDRGGTLVALGEPFEAVAGGDNIALPSEDTYVVTYDRQAETIVVEKAGGQPAASITIDGDMSDWAGVTTGVATEADPGVYQEFKVYNDDNNIYFYSKRDNRAAIWGGSGYFYYDIDADNNAATGVEKDGIAGLETWMYIKPFAGSADAPAFATEVKGEAYPSKSVIANLHFAGLNSDSFVEVEVSVPLADAGVKKGDTIQVYSWSNKDGYDVQKKPVTITIK